MLWTTWGLVLVYVLGGLTGASIALFCLAKSAQGAFIGIVSTVVTLLAMVFSLDGLVWLEAADGRRNQERDACCDRCARL